MEFLKRIFLHLTKEGVDFLDPRDNCVKIVARIAWHHEKVVRQPEDYKPKTYNTRRQIIGLARHLYVQYDVPLFMDSVWHSEDKLHQEWFVWVGQGNNIRKAPKVPEITKREAHYVMQAPRDFDMMSAIRYGQIINMGGNEPFTREILRTRVGREFNNDPFWFSVFRWFLNNPMLDQVHYAPIVDFIHNQKFVPAVEVNYRRVPVQPNFTMKDRTPDALLKQVEAWHKILGKAKAGTEHWPSCGIPGLIYETGKDDKKVVYTTQELCTKKSLIAEGQIMGHCVGSYSYSCAKGQTSVWSLERNGKEKLLTIALDPTTRTITQVRGSCNRRPYSSELSILDVWCTQARLSKSRWLI